MAHLATLTLADDDPMPPPRRRGAPYAVALAVFLLLAAPVFGLTVQQEESPALQGSRAAEQLLREGKPTEALAEIERAIAADENFAAAWYVGGIALGQLGRIPEARDYFVRATELNPAWGEAHRFASRTSFDVGDLEAAWQHAIKAHQAGTEMSEAFAGLSGTSAAPDDLDAQLSAARVFVGGFDTTKFDRDGTNSGARSVLSQAAADLFGFQQQARRQLSESPAFGLVQRQESAQYIMLTEVEFLSNSLLGSRRRLRGVLKLVDARSGEEAYRRRIDFSDINSLRYLNREWSRIMALMEEWAADRQG